MDDSHHDLSLNSKLGFQRLERTNQQLLIAGTRKESYLNTPKEIIFKRIYDSEKYSSNESGVFRPSPNKFREEFYSPKISI